MKDVSFDVSYTLLMHVFILASIFMLADEFDTSGIYEARDAVAIHYFVEGNAPPIFRRSKASTRSTDEISCLKEAIKFLQSAYETPSVLREALIHAPTIS